LYRLPVNLLNHIARPHSPVFRGTPGFDLNDHDAHLVAVELKTASDFRGQAGDCHSPTLPAFFTALGFGPLVG
jgi:hypothetical protein